MNKADIMQNILLRKWKRYADLDIEVQDKIFYRWQQNVEPYTDDDNGDFEYFSDEWEREGYDIASNDFDYSIGGNHSYVSFRAHVNAVTWLEKHKDKYEQLYPEFYKLIELANGNIDVNVFITQSGPSMHIYNTEVVYDETVDFSQHQADELLENIAEDILTDAQNKAEDLRSSLQHDYDYQFSREYFDEYAMDFYDDHYFFDDEGDEHFVQ